MDELKSRIEAMRMQEQSYGCNDYTGKSIRAKRRRPVTKPEAVPATNVATSRIVHLLLNECASLVTDPIARITTAETINEVVKVDVGLNEYPCSPSPLIEGDAKRGQDSHTHKVSPSSCMHYEDSELDCDEKEQGTDQMNEDMCVSVASNDEVIHGNPDMAMWRLQMFDWACMVVDHSQIDRSAALATSFNLLDRYTTFEMKRPNSPPITQEDYQLFAMTALYIAVKILEPFPQKMGLETVSMMSREFYRPQDIAATELEILGALRWKTTPPTAIGFCRVLMECLRSDLDEESAADMEQIYSTICDVSVSDPFFLNFSSSVIAVAALLHAARLTGKSRWEQSRLKKEAVDLVGLRKGNKLELAALNTVYKKIEQLYC